ncbi:hypothetical protein Droror1_Dr00012256 [Drosera rotundifolia]
MSSATRPNQERARLEAFAQRPTTSAATAQRPTAVQRFSSQKKKKGVATSSATQRPPDRVYAMTQEQADIAPDVVQELDQSGDSPWIPCHAVLKTTSALEMVSRRAGGGRALEIPTMEGQQHAATTEIKEGDGSGGNQG